MGLYAAEQFGEEGVKYYFLMSKCWFKVRDVGLSQAFMCSRGKDEWLNVNVSRVRNHSGSAVTLTVLLCWWISVYFTGGDVAGVDSWITQTVSSLCSGPCGLLRYFYLLLLFMLLLFLLWEMQRSGRGGFRLRRPRGPRGRAQRTWWRWDFDLTFLFSLFTAAFTEYFRVSAAAAHKNSRSVFWQITCCLLSIFVSSIRHENELIWI